MKKNSTEVKEFLTSHKCVVRYVRDVYGFKKGVVVATARNKLAWSLVNVSEDTDLTHMYPWQLPAIQYLRSKGENEIAKKVASGEITEDQRMLELYRLDSEILNDIAYEKCIKDDNWVKVPRFDRDSGFRKAIGRLSSDSQSRIRLDHQGFIVNDGDVDIPNDPDLVDTIRTVLFRAEDVLKD